MKNKSAKLRGMEERVKQFFRSLDPYNYEVYYKLPEYTESIRSQVKGMGQEEIAQTYGMLAEEVAHYMLRMYQTQYDCEILESLVFEYDKGKTTEIDLIMLTKNMIYIIECKHRSRDIEILSDGSFKSEDKIESPINQNIGHVKKLFRNTQYGALVPEHRIMSIIYLTLNNARVTNPITTFKKEVTGAFAGYKNLLPLINKIETGNAGGKIPYKTLAKEMDALGHNFRGQEGMDKHIAFLKKTYNK